MAVERLSSLLEQMIDDTPFGHPDRVHLTRLRQRNEVYRTSQVRETARHEFASNPREIASYLDRKEVIEHVLEVVSDEFGETKEKILTGGRQKELVRARIAASYLYRELGALSLQQIGVMMGGKHHTTIMYHLSKADYLKQNDFVFAESLNRTEARLLNLIKN